MRVVAQRRVLGVRYPVAAHPCVLHGAAAQVLPPCKQRRVSHFASAIHPSSHSLPPSALHGSQSAAGATAAACPLLASLACDDAIAALAWSPRANAIACLDNAGKLYFWRTPVPAGSPSPVDLIDFDASTSSSSSSSSSPTSSSSSSSSSSASASKSGGRLKKLGSGARASDEDDIDADVSMSQAEQEALEARQLAEEHARMEAAAASSPNKPKRDDDFDPDALTADDLEVINEGREQALGSFDESPESLRASMLQAVRDAMRDEFAPAMQPAMQPGATPVVEGPAAGSGRRMQAQRFLAWNDVGALLCREDDAVSHVEIEVRHSQWAPMFGVLCMPSYVPLSLWLPTSARTKKSKPTSRAEPNTKHKQALCSENARFALFVAFDVAFVFSHRVTHVLLSLRFTFISTVHLLVFIHPAPPPPPPPRSLPAFVTTDKCSPICPRRGICCWGCNLSAFVHAHQFPSLPLLLLCFHFPTFRRVSLRL